MFPSVGLLTLCLLSISYHSALAQSTTPATGAASGSPAAGAGSSVSSIASLAAGLSTSCQTSAGGLLTSEFGSCANIIGLASVIAGTGSVVPPLTTWISSICSADPCSNSTLSSARQTVDSGCSSDIQRGSPIALGLSTVITNYASVREMLCTQYVSNSTFCVPSILENVQTASGQNVTLATITSLFSSGLSASSFANVSSSTYCNDCGHALATLATPVSTNASASLNSTSTAGAAGVCGASFNDGKIPSTVRVAAKGSSAAASQAKNSAGTRGVVSSTGVIFVTLVSSLLYVAC